MDNTLSVSWDNLAVFTARLRACDANDDDDDAGTEADWCDAARRALLPTDDDRRLDRLVRGPPLLAAACVTRGLPATHLTTHNNVLRSATRTSNSLSLCLCLWLCQQTTSSTDMRRWLWLWIPWQLFTRLSVLLSQQNLLRLIALQPLEMATSRLECSITSSFHISVIQYLHLTE